MGWLLSRPRAFWVTIAIGLPLVYPLSFGPACWLWWRGCLPRSATAIAYRPLVLIARNGPEPYRSLLKSYAELLAQPMTVTKSAPLVPLMPPDPRPIVETHYVIDSLDVYYFLRPFP